MISRRSILGWLGLAPLMLSGQADVVRTKLKYDPALRTIKRVYIDENGDLIAVAA